MLTYRVGLSKARRQERSLTARKAETIREMASGGFRLDLLLGTASLPLSTYYYQVKKLVGLDKDKEIKGKIQEIYYEQKEIMGIAERLLN